MREYGGYGEKLGKCGEHGGRDIREWRAQGLTGGTEQHIKALQCLCIEYTFAKLSSFSDQPLLYCYQ